MRRLFYYLRGYAVIEICGAAPGWALNKLAEERIAFWDIEWIDALTVRLKVFRGKEATASALTQTVMCDTKIIRYCGFFQPIEQFLGRPILAVMTCMALLVSLFLPCFLFFFEVEGNEAVPEALILRELEQTGITFGTFGPRIYPREIKDHMIEALPQLQWVTVEQHGCRGKVIVRERELVPQTETKKGFANVVALQSGVITKQSVYTGQAQFQVGDTVTQGDILVSGIVDLERTYLIERANAEIFARTWREISVCIPSLYTEKTIKSDARKCIWLILGGRRIKIFGNSGISHTSCDKIISNKDLALPMGMSLPVSLEIETFTFYDEADKIMNSEAAELLLKDYPTSAVIKKMCAGEILHQSQTLREERGLFCLDAVLECHEMIAEVVEAKWNNEDFLND